MPRRSGKDPEDRVGCDLGPINGTGRAARRLALKRFAGLAGLGIAMDAPSLRALELIEGKTKRVCGFRSEFLSRAGAGSSPKSNTAREAARSAFGTAVYVLVIRRG